MTTKSAPGTTIPLCFARTYDRAAEQVRCAEITYIPIGRGFLDLVAVTGWARGVVLAWRLSKTMDASFCVAA
ncbi:hypothetical protein [Bradyrhizobium sp. WSM1743]|uniref:hypothetical protein n=1 Tax=Bradyrhizobium sp. WSM1743 TaxID=318996 RepID=UPI000400E0FA|nr:hypothetical protein [Bradyrhizobium sp. WSM1743]